MCISFFIVDIYFRRGLITTLEANSIARDSRLHTNPPQIHTTRAQKSSRSTPTTTRTQDPDGSTRAQPILARNHTTTIIHHHLPSQPPAPRFPNPDISKIPIGDISVTTTTSSQTRHRAPLVSATPAGRPWALPRPRKARVGTGGTRTTRVTWGTRSRFQRNNGRRVRQGRGRKPGPRRGFL